MTGNLHAKLSSNSPNVNYIENYIFEWGKSSDGHMTYWNINLTTKVNEKIEKKAVADRGEGSGGGGGWGGGLIFKTNWGLEGRKKFFWDRLPPLLISGSGWPGPLHYLKVWIRKGLNPQLKRDNGELKRAWMSSIREVQNVLGQVIFKINEPKKKWAFQFSGRMRHWKE